MKRSLGSHSQGLGMEGMELRDLRVQGVRAEIRKSAEAELRKRGPTVIFHSRSTVRSPKSYSRSPKVGNLIGSMYRESQH